jgi:hypothetical protein
MKKLHQLNVNKLIFNTFTKRNFHINTKIFNKIEEFTIKGTHYETLGLKDAYANKPTIIASYRKVFF